MYKVSIPVNCDKFYRAKNKQLILDELRAFDADRVMLNFETTLDGHILLYNEESYRRQIDRMREACAFFKSHGYEVGAWFWGSVSDPKRGGTIGCCRCGQCLSAGECVYRKKLLENSGAETQK